MAIRPVVLFILGTVFSAIELIPALAATIDVEIEGVRSTAGQVYVSLCSQTHFMRGGCEYETSVPARLGNVHVQFAEVTSGVWAMQSYHDEKNLGHPDFDWLGIPQNGSAQSNDAIGHYGPPRFRDAKIEIEGDLTITAKMRY